MKLSDLPTRFPVPFADQAGAGFIRPIPVDSQIGITNGAASLETGFPPSNFLPIAGGGTRPFGQDLNGILNQATAWLRWQGAGGPVQYNADFANDIGGYPKGAVLASTTFALLWISALDDNAQDPDDPASTNWNVLRFANQTSIITASTTLNMTAAVGLYGFARVTSPAAMTANLPPVNPQYAGLQWTVVDLVGNFNAANVRFVPPAGNTISGKADFTLNEDFQSAIFSYFGGTTWSVST